MKAMIAVAMLCAISLSAVAALPQAAHGPVLVLRVEGVMGPATSEFVHRGLETARARRAQLVVLEMDTPGGLDTSMRAIIKDILASPIAVATYVAPEGARAASAGTYIVYASHIAAMAPATNLGAATPVAIGLPGAKPKPASNKEGKAAEKASSGRGAKDDASPDASPEPADTMSAKATNDAAAYIRSLAQLRGRNAEFAEEAVRQASSLSADEALKGGVVDVIAVDVADLIRKIDGREVELSGVKTKLQLAGAPVTRIEPDWRMRLLAIFSNPTLAVALLMIGFYGLFVEFTSPGFGVPGVAGTIAVLLGLYALQLLPLNWAGIGLLLLGSALMIAEVFLPSFGVLGVGGIVAFIFGGLMLVETTAPGFGVPLWVVVAMALISAAVFMGFGTFALRARHRPVVSGQESLLGSLATVERLDDGITWVWLNGERWQARAAVPNGDAPQVRVGDRVRVVAVDGLTLIIRPDNP